MAAGRTVVLDCGLRVSLGLESRLTDDLADAAIEALDHVVDLGIIVCETNCRVREILPPAQATP